jgi:hypothetical protein
VSIIVGEGQWHIGGGVQATEVLEVLTKLNSQFRGK